MRSWTPICRITARTCQSVPLTSRYLDVQSCADERHQGGGEVDAHVLVHRHVHQHQPLTDNEGRRGDRRTFIHSIIYICSVFQLKIPRKSIIFTFPLMY